MGAHLRRPALLRPSDPAPCQREVDQGACIALNIHACLSVSSSPFFFLPPDTIRRRHTHDTQQQAPPTPLDSIDSSSNSTLALSLSASATTIGPARSFEVDRQALLIARAALDAARLKAEGKTPPVAVAAAGYTPWSAYTPAVSGGIGVSSSGGVRRLPTMELNGSFSSNFHLSPQSGKALAEGASIAAIAGERSEEAAP